MNFTQMLNKLQDFSQTNPWKRWWIVTILQVIASLVAAPLAIGLLSQLP